MKTELYTADWCSACKTVKPILTSMDGLDLEIVDVEKETDRAVSLGIRNIPVVRFLDTEGVEKGRLVGKKSKQEIEAYIESI